MTPDFTDPAMAAKLVKLIDALRQGSALSEAVAKAGVSPDVADRFLQSVKASIKVSMPSKTRPDPPMPTGSVDHVVAFSDGASRGNPGPAACAVILTDAEGEEIYRRARLLGRVTNNVAEYEGVILAAEIALALKVKQLELRLDSELVVKQLNGAYKVKNEALKPLFRKARVLLDALPDVEIAHVPRAENKAADKLANAALDGKDLDGE